MPAGGLIRDGTRWLALLVPLEAVAFGAGVHTIFYRAEFTSWEVPVMVFALVLPLAAMPDMAWGVGDRLKPATYPAAWTDARRVVETTKVRGDIVVLPFSSYRRPSWNHDTSVLDPAGRFFDRTTVVERRSRGLRAARSGARIPVRPASSACCAARTFVAGWLARASGSSSWRPTHRVPAPALRQVRGARELEVKGRTMRVFAIPGARPKAIDEEDRRVMIAAWAVAGLTLLLSLVGAVRGAVERRRRKPVPMPSRTKA